MIFNATQTLSVRQSRAYLEQLIAQGGYYEIKRFSPKRTLKQNSYIHKLFQLFGTHFGLTIDESKELVMKALGYKYFKTVNGKEREFRMHTSQMSVDELVSFTDKFKAFSLQQGCVLPDPNEYIDNQVQIENEIAYKYL